MGPDNDNQISNKSKNIVFATFPKLLLGLVIGLILGVTITILVTKNNTQIRSVEKLEVVGNNTEPVSNEITNNLNNNLISKHYITTKSKVYENTRLGYKIYYPRGITQVYDCPDYPCASIRDFTIRMEPLSFYGEEEILNDDLYCSANGPQGSIRCENPQISEYTSILGIKGFAVKRLRIIESREFEGYEVVNTKTEQFDETVYIFPINGNSSYKAILLATDAPNEKNLEELKKIADSFRLSD